MLLSGADGILLMFLMKRIVLVNVSYEKRTKNYLMFFLLMFRMKIVLKIT